MRIRRKLAYAALATSLVACFEDLETEGQEEQDLSAGDAQPEAPPYSDAGAGQAGDAQVVGAPSNGMLKLPSRGSAIALSEDDAVAVVANRDVGSVSVLALNAQNWVQGANLLKELSLGEGSEPWQVAIGPDGDTAFAILRKDQQLVKLTGIRNDPQVGGRAKVGSEPTSLALSPSGRYAYVTNWNDGTISEIDTQSLTPVSTIDLNGPLVATGYLGQVNPRPALAHPRSIVISNDGDGDDADETLWVTEFFGQQTEPVLGDGSNADTHKVGLVYRVALHDRSVKTINLSPLADMGFKDNKGGVAGCFPNQVQSIALGGKFAYVVSVCASPEGPLGAKLTTTTCNVVEDCAGLSLVEPVCVIPTAGKASVCADVSSVKTTTAPLLSVIDTDKNCEVKDAQLSLNAAFDKQFRELKLPAGAQRFPLFTTDVAFVPGQPVGYVTAGGADAVFRFRVDPESGKVVEVGASTSPFVDLNPAGIAANEAGRSPIGIAIGAANKKLALVANEITRNVSLLDFNTQAIAGGLQDPQVVQTAALPPAGSDADRILRGKRFFNTGTARWSLLGQGWGACQSCHADALTDNVTWYFARGPRQSVSLDGSFASKNPHDQRLFNWTAIKDETDDFEDNTRDISGGVGAIVSAVSAPPQTSDRIDFVGLGHANLNGSSTKTSDPANPLGLDPAPKLEDWKEIERYIQTIRAPRAPSNLDKYKVDAGYALFTHDGSCQGCHGGEKWTISQRFYEPGVATNQALNVTPFAIPAGFPQLLLPSLRPENQTLRFNGGNAAAFDQIQCAIRPVGTFNVAETGVGIAELRADMVTVSQGNGNADGEGKGYNVPSLMGVAAGAPYLHGGNARTLEALFSDTFAPHHRALAPNFLTESNPAELAQARDNLIQFLLSIDEATPPLAIPPAGAGGGLLCPTSFGQ